MDIYEANKLIWSKPLSERFTEEEIKGLKKNFPKDKYLAKYAIWKQVRRNGKYLAFIIDNSPYRTRKCAADHSLEVISTRALTNKEYQEQIENLGGNSRVMEAWYFKSILGVIKSDKLYDITTPDEFVKEATKRGYNTPLPGTQATLF